MLWRLIEFLLLAEVATVILLCIPLPMWRKLVLKCLPLFRNPNLRKAIMATQFLCGVLFLDALIGVYRPKHQYFPDRRQAAVHDEHHHMVRKFRAERNIHISGFCLLLLFLINRLMAFILELEETHKKLNIKTEQVQLLSDQLEARAAATAEERAHRAHERQPTSGARDSGSNVRRRAVAATTAEE
ncbi:hypothetical protein PTSG_05518 [Salpingoeca rosetta]|uniref:Endoplasmic reticulum transmembrane protein n=1 Tax=Salpingoeca rosetta (strain ATCC 50818 / BSB-021) TaxID=946362 RepID=F2UBF9_SALR5|nr:uncharacterized protein PTSG_05518 [Salpingoeca rosetta]EGD73825.1 hypothetical protein PTSG_05518 [Salpingoeca rosetta]|eukprot:XP_004993388.1 hypothetical protein PTSG_05518 [Salpingoeca rosetta]